MNKIIPGHARAYTIWLFLILAFVAYFQTKNWSVVLGLFLFMLGSFLGDQATHLAQNDHSGTPPTWLERQMQNYRYLYVVLSFILAISGLIIII